jgi:exodeoxyribonuclease VII small subunit
LSNPAQFLAIVVPAAGAASLAQELRGKFPFSNFAVVLNCFFAAMSNPVKKPASPANFEQAMQRLEEIVEKMESGDLPLEELIVRYEEGMKLVKLCQERLASAEQRIEIITRNNAGKPIVKEFELATANPATPPEPKGEANDVSLF